MMKSLDVEEAWPNGLKRAMIYMCLLWQRGQLREIRKGIEKNETKNDEPEDSSEELNINESLFEEGAKPNTNTNN